MTDDDKFEIAAGPAKVSGSGKSVTKIGSAIADLISPFSEGFGLVGDHIRIHRERSAVRLLERAKEVASEQGRDIKAVHPKNLIPLLENASMDDGGQDEVTELWARLLLSGSETFDAEMAQYSDILKRLGKREAELLKNLCVDSEMFPLQLVSDRINKGNSQRAQRVLDTLTWETGEEQLRKIIDNSNANQILIYGRISDCFISSNIDDSDYSFFSGEMEVARVLEREQLIRVVHLYKSDSLCDIQLTFADLTIWGVRLIRRCYPDLVRDAEARKRNATKSQ